MALEVSPGVQLQPSSEQVALATNYITDFNFLKTQMPELYEKEFSRYGDRSVASFLRHTSSEKPFSSDLIKWSEEGRLHTKYTNCSSGAAANAPEATITVIDTITGKISVRVGQTVMLSKAGTGSNKAIVTAVDTTAGTFDVAYYGAAGQAFGAVSGIEMFIYGSEFGKGTSGMVGSLEAQTEIYENSPIILKDKYSVNGSDMTQIGWIKVEGDESGWLWFIKSKHDTRVRFEDYLETSGLEAVPAEAGSGVATQTTSDQVGKKGSEGVFYVVGDRGNVWGAGNPTTLEDWDTVVARMDSQGKIEENAIFHNRQFGFDIDNMLATLNGYNGTGSANGASFGLFDNKPEMALNLGFSGFRRGYDFYKTDWKYLNDPTMRGGITDGGINGMMVPVGTKTIYDYVLGKNAKLPFLHVRYRMSAKENRKLKTWITGSAGGASNSDLDAMEVHWLSERATVTLGANNFMLFNK